MCRLKLKWTRRALEQFVEAQKYIAQENPNAARQVGQRIADATKLLLTQPLMGHKGRVAGTREWVVRRAPYFLVYKLENDELIILRVIHSKQNWP